MTPVCPCNHIIGGSFFDSRNLLESTVYCTNSFPHVCNNGIFDEVRLKHTLVLHEIMHKISQKKQMKVFFGVCISINNYELEGF